MSTATAPITDKATRATQLRSEAAALTREVTELKEKLEIAQRTLGVLQEKRQKFTEDAGRGRTLKPGEIAALNVAIDEAMIPVEGLTNAVKSKEAALDTVRDSLATLDYELGIESQRGARQARFDALEKQGIEAAARIAEKLRALIQDDLPTFDVVRTALNTEFVDAGGMLNGGMLTGEAIPARELIHSLEAGFRDGSYLKVEREMLRAGFIDAGETGLSFLVKTLRAPRS